MTAIPQLSARPTAFVPKPHRWTCEQFHDMGDANALEGHSVILVDGEILAMPNPSPAHDTATSLADYLLKDLFRGTHTVRVQTGFPTTLDTDPVPDISVVPGSPRDYLRQHPRVAVLVIEVADSSLTYDIGEKSNLYAAAGIADYWVIDVNTPQLFVFRDPVPDPSAPRGFRYNTIRTLNRGDSIAPLAQPAATITVADLLP